MEKIIKFTSKTVVLPNEDVDTDQIVPARFLTLPSKVGIGECLFYDWRYNESGEPNKDFILNKKESRDCSVLVAGNNFGCGSSREHAPWALVDFGFKAIISTSFADIFKNNCLKNGLIPITVPKNIHDWLMDNPRVEVTIDLEKTLLHTDQGHEASFPIESFSRYCLMNGMDQLGYILSKEAEIQKHENKL
jgi:3-isopropylmalate/(R)-2-methylmalate dehydratase small subunit